MTKKKRESARRARLERNELGRMIAANQQMDEEHNIYEVFAPKPTQLELENNRRVSELQGVKLGHELQGEEVRAELAAGDVSPNTVNEMQ